MRWAVVLVVLVTLAFAVGWLVPGGGAGSEPRPLDGPSLEPARWAEAPPAVLEGMARPLVADPEREAEAPEPTQRENLRVPPDPVETGDARLAVEFRDPLTGAPRATGFSLWRLDAPGNEAWTEGDQCQFTRGRAVEHETLTGLPEGRYRLHLHHVAADAADPPPFLVQGVITNYRFEVAPPPTFQVHVAVYDERGGRRVRASRRHGRPSRTWADASHPDWAKRRRERANDLIPLGGGAGSAFASSGFSSPEVVTAAPSGLPLGAFQAATRYAWWENRFWLDFDGHVRVEVRIANRARPSRPLVALAPTEAWIREHIVLEDGRRIDETDDLTLHACCEAIEPAIGQDAWEAASALGVRVEARRGWEVVASATLYLEDREVVLRP